MRLDRTHITLFHKPGMTNLERVNDAAFFLVHGPEGRPISMSFKPFAGEDRARVKLRKELIRKSIEIVLQERYGLKEEHAAVLACGVELFEERKEK